MIIKLNLTLKGNIYVRVLFKYKRYVYFIQDSRKIFNNQESRFARSVLLVLA